MVGSPPTWGDMHIQAQVTGKAGLDLSPSASQGTPLHKPHVQRAVDFSATFHRCVCVYVHLREQREHSSLPRGPELAFALASPVTEQKATSWSSLPAPPLRALPAHSSLCSIYAPQRYLLCLFMWLCFFSFFSYFIAISYVGSRGEPQSMTLRHQLGQKLPRPSAHTSVSPLITWD